MSHLVRATSFAILATGLIVLGSQGSRIAHLSDVACPVTETYYGKPPPQRGAGPFGLGAYYVNEDRSIWLRSRHWSAGRSDKTIWIRPQGTELKVVGRRLDGEAPPLQVKLPKGYNTGFQAGSMMFPTEGCWEVRATAGERELLFIVSVAPGV